VRNVMNITFNVYRAWHGLTSRRGWRATRCPDNLQNIVDPELGSPRHSVGRRYALPLAATSIFLMAANGGLGLVVKLFLQQEGFSPFVISLVSSVNAAGVLLGSMLWGRWSDRGARRKILFFTVLGVVASIGVLTTLPPAAVVLSASFGRTFMRMGFTTVSMALISGASVQARRGKNLSYVTAARSMGFAMGSIASGFVLERIGFRGAFTAMTLLPLLGIAFLWLVPSSIDAPTSSVRERSSWRAAFSLGIADLYASTMLRQMAIHGAFSLLAVYMAGNGIPPSLIGVIAAMNTGTQVLALLVFGRLADRIGRRRIFMLGFALSALTPCVFALSPHVVVMALGYVSLGTSFSALYIGSTAYIGDRVPQERQGTMLGLYEMSRGMGGVIGPVVAGKLTPLIGYRLMFIAMAGIAALGFLVMQIRRTKPRELQS